MQKNKDLSKPPAKSLYAGRLMILLLSLVFVAGCSKEKTEDLSPQADLYNFSFLKKKNPSLKADINLQTTGKSISGSLPYDADIKNLVASFETNGASVAINNQPQQSGISINDFTQIVSYTITAQNGNTSTYEVDAKVFTGLPIFFITTENGEEIVSKEDYMNGHISFYGGRNFEDLNSDMEIRGRGNSTWFVHPKKPYQMKLEEKAELMGMPEDKKWLFLAEHSDKTFLRNKVAFELGYLSNLAWTPKSEFAEVFINDAYNGTYNITQKVEVDKNRVNLSDNGYLLEIDQFDRLDPGDVYFYSSQFLLNIKAPELENGSAEFNYIVDYISEFESTLYGDHFTDDETGYKKYIDVESFVDWYLVSEITKNQDSRDFSSIYMHLEPGGKLFMGPLWDFDLAFGNVNYSDCQYPEGFWVKHHAWISRLFEDPDFVELVKERFAYFKSNENQILNLIDSNASLLMLPQAENDERWDVIGNWIWPNGVVLGSYQEEVNYLKSWIEQRFEWLDSAYAQMQ